MPISIVKGIKIVLCDIDDTLTTSGKLTSAAYQAVEDLDRAGIAVVPITGRPAGWCDMIARFWPVKGVVGENGAFYYTYDLMNGKMIRKLHPAVENEINRSNRFDGIMKRIKVEVPGAAISADQPFRLADLAVDFCEDVKPLSKSEVAKIVKIFEDEGATAKISSIHVNGWFGKYDKLTTTKSFVTEILKIDLNKHNWSVIFIGDSPNDVPMFEYFENSCGVANVCSFQNTISAPPKWVSNQSFGAGFREIVNFILSTQD